jgi:hypothetical protein
MKTIKNSLNYLQLGIAPHHKHNYALRKWQRVMWFVTLYIWRALLLFGIIYLLYKIVK